MTAKPKRSSGELRDTEALQEILTEVEAVKRLMVLLLAKLGSDSNEIAMALGVAPTTIRSWIPMRRVTRVPFGGGQSEE
jgi:hypothetical protein